MTPFIINLFNHLHLPATTVPIATYPDMVINAYIYVEMITNIDK